MKVKKKRREISEGKIILYLHINILKSLSIFDTRNPNAVLATS